MIELDLLADGSEYDYTQTTVLDGVAVVFRVQYNSRRECWTISLELEDGTSLISGQTLVLNTDLLARCFVDGRPPGNLFAGTYTATAETPGLTGVGGQANVRLFYVPVDELE
jgi:hypothetical protein